MNPVSGPPAGEFTELVIAFDLLVSRGANPGGLAAPPQFHLDLCFGHSVVDFDVISADKNPPGGLLERAGQVAQPTGVDSVDA